MTAEPAQIVLTDITKDYEGPEGVLEGITLTVEPGETVAIIGPSGSGKSTLLNIVGSLDKPTSGTVHIGSIDVAALNGRALSAFRAKQVGFVFQDHHLLPQLTALENVLLPTIAARRDPDAAARARELMERVAVSHRADAFPAQMSGGERQRVAVARALINAPCLLLCDEPTGSLDREAGSNAVALLLEVARRQEATVIMVTHNVDYAARFGRCLELRDGKLIPFGAPGEARARK